MKYISYVLSIPLMLTPAVILACYYPPLMALAFYLAFIVLGTLLGCAFLSLQPIGESTFLGRLGSKFVRWGYIVGNGKLPAAAVISIFLWTLLGGAAIAIVNARGHLLFQALILMWIADTLAALYIISVLLTKWRGRFPPALLGVTAALAALIAVSAATHFTGNDPAATFLALLIASAPALLIGLPYGLFILVILFAGKKVRWN